MKTSPDMEPVMEEEIWLKKDKAVQYTKWNQLNQLTNT